MKAEEGVRGGGCGGGGRKSGAGGLKKGPWTPAEDAILMEHVRKHGEGNWNAVQRHSGLARCGKSCRLRWANHLRPNLKKGSFTPDEELLILHLHAQLGNKWARMAAQLPGRTDNEIKNYWNTRLKRRQRAGLPIYPPEIKESAQHQASATPVADYSGANFPSLRPAPLLDPAGLFPLQPPFPRNPFQCHPRFGLPISPGSPPSTPTSMLRPPGQFWHGGYDLTPPPPLPLPSLSPLSRPIVEKSELPSSQFFPQPYAGGIDGRGNFGLLEALLHDSHIDGDIKIGDLLSLPVAGDQNAIWGQLLNVGSGDGSSSDDRDGIKDACQGFSFESMPKLEAYDCDNGGAKFSGEVAGDAGTAKDDLSALLDIPMQTISMIPEWCSTNDGAEFANGSGQSSSAMASDEMGSAFLRWLLPSPPPPPPPQQQQSTIGTSVHGHGVACLESVKDIII